MSRLVLTTDAAAAGYLKRAASADLVVPLGRRPLASRLPSDEEAKVFYGDASANGGSGWQALARSGNRRFQSQGSLIELCDTHDEIELWVGPGLEDQLALCQLLHFLAGQRVELQRFGICLSDVPIGRLSPEQAGGGSPTKTMLDEHHLALASVVWQAVSADNPIATAGLINLDTTALTHLHAGVERMLFELPSIDSALGGSETELSREISRRQPTWGALLESFDAVPALFHMTFTEVACLVDRLAHCETPAVLGLEGLRFSDSLSLHDLEMADLRNRQLSLSAFGLDLLKGAADFSKQNTVDRWWGGTHLTNAALWRWDERSKRLHVPA